MAEFTLHCFSESGNAYKAALMLELCEADWQARKVKFFAGVTRGPEFREMNVMGEVPVLVHHGEAKDHTLSQSGVILTYLSRRFGRFGPRDEQEEYEILRWILFDNHKLTGNVASARFLFHFRDRRDDPATQFMLARANAALAVLDAHLEKREWVAAERTTIADLSLCGYLFWPGQIPVDWHEYPNIDAWLGRIRSLPGWKMPEDLMPSGQA